MEPNFVRMKVPEFKKYLQSVSRISASRRSFGFFGKSYSCTNLPLSLLLFRRLLNQFGPRHQRTRTANKEYQLLQKQNVLLSILFICYLTFCIFLEVNIFYSQRSVVFPFTALDLSSGSVRLFGGFRRRCCGNTNIEGTGIYEVGPRPPSKLTKPILVCFVTFKLSRRQVAIHRICRRSRYGIPAT